MIRHNLMTKNRLTAFIPTSFIKNVKRGYRIVIFNDVIIFVPIQEEFILWKLIVILVFMV